MTTLALHGNAMLAVVKRDFIIFRSYRFRLLTQVMTVFLSTTMFYYVSRLVNVELFSSSDAYFAFVIIGLLIYSVINSSLGLPSLIYGEIAAGTFERVVISPFGVLRGAAAMTVFPFLRAVVVCIITLLLAAFAYDLPVTWSTAPLAIPISVMAVAAFGSLGLLFTAALLLARQSVTGVGWVMAVIGLVSGFYFPPSLLPAWIRWASEVQPFTPTLELMRHVMVGTPLSDSWSVLMLKLAGFGAILVPLSVFALAGAVAFARRRGTILEV